MNKKPVIGIAPNYSYDTKAYSLHEDYVLAIEKPAAPLLCCCPIRHYPIFWTVCF